MNILSVAFPFAPITPQTAGGAEQILLTLDKAITSSGNDSTVIAEPASEITGKLIQTKPVISSTICQHDKESKWIEYRHLISQILTDDSIDLIHFHGYDFYSYLPGTNIPILCTLHLPFSSYGVTSFDQRFYFTCVSSYQYSKYKSVIPHCSLIVNGIDVPETFTFSNTSDYVLAIGRICPEKGYHLALLAAKKAHVPLVIAGTVYPYEEHITYFKESIQPHLDKHDYCYIGAVDKRQKDTLYRSARCLLVPSLVEETSSLVAMESLAHGTPVIAFRAGALEEIVINGVNGFLVDNVDEMAEAIGQIHTIDKEQCYQIAKEKYSAVRMTTDYLSLYNKIAHTKNNDCNNELG